MHHHARWLVDDEHVVIFIANVQWNGFRKQFSFFRLRQGDADFLAALQA
jgi:hypothetical protein